MAFEIIRVAPQNPTVDCDHLEPITRVKRICLRIGSFSGMRIMDDNFKFNYLTAITCLITAFAILFSMSTTWKLRHSYELMSCMVSLGIAIPGAAKLYYGIKYATQFRAMLKVCDDLYMVNCSPPRYEALFDVAKRNNRTALITAVISLLGMSGFAAVPVYDYLVLGDLHLLLYIHIPAVDIEKPIGFMVTTLMQVVMSVYGVLGSLHFDLSLVLLVLNYRAMVVVMRHQLETFEQMYGDPAGAKPTPRLLAKRRAFLRNMLIQFNDANRWVGWHNVTKCMFEV